MIGIRDSNVRNKIQCSESGTVTYGYVQVIVSLNIHIKGPVLDRIVA